MEETHMPINRWMDKEDVVILWNEMEYYSVIKMHEITPFAVTWMSLESIILSEVSQTKTNILWYHFYVESKKWYNELIHKTKVDWQT